MPNRVKRFQAGGETEEDRRLQDLEDQVMGKSRPYKRGERMMRLLDPTMDPVTGERDVRGYLAQKVANVLPGLSIPGRQEKGERPLMNLLREANRVSKAYHGQDYAKELQDRIMSAGTRRVDKDTRYDPNAVKLSADEEYQKGGKVGRGDGIAKRGKTRGRMV
jgi:hypothetical protein